MHLLSRIQWLSSELYPSGLVCSLSTSILALVTNLRCGQVNTALLTCEEAMDIEAHCPTDDVFKSTVHRAINKSGKERYSIPLFFGTDYHVNIEVCNIFSTKRKMAVSDRLWVCLSSPYRAVCLPTGQRNIALLLLESM